MKYKDDESGQCGGHRWRLFCHPFSNKHFPDIHQQLLHCTVWRRLVGYLLNLLHHWQTDQIWLTSTLFWNASGPCNWGFSSAQEIGQKKFSRINKTYFSLSSISRRKIISTFLNIKLSSDLLLTRYRISVCHSEYIRHITQFPLMTWMKN